MAISKELKLEILEYLDKVFESNESVKEYYIKKNTLMREIYSNYDINKIGICLILSDEKYIEKAYGISTSTCKDLYEYYSFRNDLLTDLGIERMIWENHKINKDKNKFYQFWYETREQRSAAIKESLRILKSTLEENGTN